MLKTVYSNENISAADESLDIQAGDILVLTPAWGEQTYRLTFCANAEDAIIISSDISGDTQHNSQRFTYSETFTIYQDAIRENYTLVGWALTEDGEVKYKNNDTAYFSDVFSDNSFRYLYAVWEPNNKWTLRYDLGDDGYWSGEAPQTQYSYSMSESHIVIDDDPRRTIPGYALRAWKVAKESDPNTIITTVGSGDVISPDDETYNIQIGDALILTPFWLEMTYIVHYYANAEDAVIIGEDISGSTQSNTLKFKYQEKVTVYQDAIRQGYKLAGWALSEDGDIKYKNRQEVTSAELFGEDMYSANLYAVWEPDTSWTVKYELGETGEWDGVAPQTEYVYSLNESHTVISDEPKSKAAGYGFRNWEIRKQSDPETIIATVNDGYEIAPEDETYNIKAGDILIFTPVWYEHSYRITFNKNADDALMIGGDISDGSRPVERYYKYNDTVTIYQEAIRENYILAGWAETEDGEVKYKNGDMTDIPSLFGPIYTKIVLYAVWEKSIPLTGITLNKTSMTLAKGITETLNIVYNPEDTTDDKTVTWESSDPSVATVEEGTVTAVSAGTATITATVGGKSASCEVTVVEKEKVEMYRMYNPYTQEHLYTGLEGERDNLVDHGWIYEGFGFYAPKESSTPMYRLYNPNNSDHHYTASEEEIEFCVRNGWIREGICWYADDDKEVAQYRLFNPYIEVGSHHYTYSEEERDFLASIGWIYEGIGFYTCK